MLYPYSHDGEVKGGQVIDVGQLVVAGILGIGE
jgi:hypothetical protein